MYLKAKMKAREAFEENVPFREQSKGDLAVLEGGRSEHFGLAQ